MSTVDAYRRSRSPPPRRRNDSPQRRGQISPRPRSRSPPPSRIRLGSHSIDIGSHHLPECPSPSHPPDSSKRVPERSPSPYRRRRSKSPSHKRGHTPPVVTNIKDEAQSLPQSLRHEVTEILVQSSDSKTPLPPPEAAPHPPRKPLADRRMEVRLEPERQAKQKMPEMPPTSPKRTQATGSQPAPQPSRSPPRGPRNHAKGNSTPTGPAFSYPPGPQGQRRQQPAVAVPPTPALPTPPSVPASSEPQVPPAQFITDAPKVPLPTIPPWEPRPSVTRELDVEVVFFFCYCIKVVVLLTYNHHRSVAFKHIALTLPPNTRQFRSSPGELCTSLIWQLWIYVRRRHAGGLLTATWKKHALACLVLMPY